MKNSILTESILAILAIAVLAVPGVSHARESKLSEQKERLIYSRAFEAILWASPTLAVYCQAEAGTRDLGAGHLDIVYTGKMPDYRWGGVFQTGRRFYSKVTSSSVRHRESKLLRAVRMW